MVGVGKKLDAVWDHFVRVKNQNVVSATCKYCQLEMSGIPGKLRIHIGVCQNYNQEQPEINITIPVKENEVGATLNEENASPHLFHDSIMSEESDEIYKPPSRKRALELDEVDESENESVENERSEQYIPIIPTHTSRSKRSYTMPVKTKIDDIIIPISRKRSQPYMKNSRGHKSPSTPRARSPVTEVVSNENSEFVTVEDGKKAIKDFCSNIEYHLLQLPKDNLLSIQSGIFNILAKANEKSEKNQ